MDAAVTIHTGRIRVASPFQNQYLVTTDIGDVLATALETGSGRRGGHIGGGAYVPGSTVLVAKIDVTHEQSTRVALPNLIMGAFNPFPTFEGTDFEETWVQQGSNADAIRNPGYRSIVDSEPGDIINENRGANRPLDILPGDWFKSSVLGGLILLSEFMTKIGSSPDCALTFNGVDQLAELVSMNFSADHASVFKEIIHRGPTSVDIARYAFNLSEAMGQSIPFSSTDEDSPWKLEPADESMTGLFRDERFSGGAVEGAWNVCRTTAGQSSHAFGESVYPGVLSEMVRMDGIYRLRAAKEIKFEKTPSIVTPWTKQELRGAGPSDVDVASPEGVDTAQRQEVAGLATEDEVYALMPLLHDLFSSAEEASAFFQGLRQDGHVWHFPTPDEAREALLGSDPVEKSRVLNPFEKEYTLSDMVHKDVEIYPGRKVRLFDNSSVFLMAEDGGIMIGDGHGGEIRMNRGRVSIASIGDIEILPGRDLIEQVPGNRISRTGKRVEFSSTEGSVAIKAEANLQMTCGGPGGGMMTLENKTRSTKLADIPEETLRGGLPFGAGIVLKSPQAGVAMLGSYIYGAGHASGSGSKQGVESASTPCRIMLDAGSSDLLMSGNNGILSFRSSASLTMLESVTGLHLTASNMTQVAKSGISLNTPEVRLEGARGSTQHPVLRSAKVDLARRGQLPTQDTNLVVAGGILSGSGGLATEGNIASEGGVSANQGVNLSPITDPQLKHKFDVKQGQQAREQAAHQVVVAVSNATRTMMETMVSIGVATERGQHIAGLAFPDSDSDAYRATNYQIIAPRWQTNLTDEARTWIERSVSHAIVGDTYPYPGKAAHMSQSALIVRNGDTISSLPLSKYKTNIPS